MAIAYVTIELATHTYKATVNSVRDLETHLSAETRPFTISDVEILDYSQAHSMADSLNRISRYGQHDKAIALLKLI